MKILYYSPHPQLNLEARTGYGTHMREMIAGFRDEGAEVKTVIQGGLVMPAINVEVKANPFKKLAKNILPGIMWRSLKERRLIAFDKNSEVHLEAEVDQFQPDIIYERMAYLCRSGAAVASRKGIKYVVEINAPFPEEVRDFEKSDSFYDRRGRQYMSEVLHAAHLIVTVSSAMRTYLEKEFSVRSDKIAVVPNCVSPEHIQVQNDKVAGIRSDLFPQKKHVIGFVGSIFPYHGVDLLVKAFAAVRKIHPDSALLIVGDGQQITELKELTASLNCTNDVVFTGSVVHSEVFNYIMAMDITVMAASNWYGSPVKIFEYGFMGKPIIAPDTIPVRDVMVHKQDGILIRPDAEELKAAICYCIEHPDSTAEMAASFKQKVRTRHIWTQAAAGILLTLRSLT